MRPASDHIGKLLWFSLGAQTTKLIHDNIHVGEVHHLDAKEGGTYRMSFTNFGTGQTHSFGGTYRKLEPGSLLEYDDQFDDPHLPGQMSVSVRIQPVMCGVELTITQEGIPEMIPVEMCYLGWQESLKKLARLVEPEIPS